MTVYISIVAARRIAGDGPLAQADLVLDEVVELHGVTVEQSWPSGGYVAVPPRRPFGDRRPVLSWSGAVASDIAQAILARLNGRAATAGSEAEQQIALELLTADRAPDDEWLIPASELPPDPRKPAGRVDLDELDEAIAAEPGIGRAPLAAALDVGRDAIAAAAARLEAAGRIRAERNGHGWQYYPAVAPELAEPPGMGPSSGAVRAPAPTAPATPPGGPA